MNPPNYPEVLARLDILLLQRLGGRSFAAPGKPPAWVRLVVGDLFEPGRQIEPASIFPFLDHFLEDAERFWAGKGDGELQSGSWAESPIEGADLHLDAVALKVDGLSYLLIRNLGAGFEQIQGIMQKGRELSLVHERLAAEINQKEILLHCIIHDMSGPLQGMLSALELAKKEVPSPAAKTVVEFGILAAKQQATLIDDLLETFRSELMPKDGLAIDPATAPDAVACAKKVLTMLEPVFNLRGLKSELRAPEDATEVRVVAEASRLERVFYNLIQNAIRYSPRNGEISVSIAKEADGSVRLTVEDQGPGVPPEVAPQLFQKFVRHGNTQGKAGLGLFFCRITVEQWSGAIGCEPRAGGGTVFWFRLLSANPQGAPA